MTDEGVGYRAAREGAAHVELTERGVLEARLQELVRRFDSAAAVRGS